MTWLDLFGPDASLGDLARQFPDFSRAGHDMADAVVAMGDEFSRAELELIASYASALNRCSYCLVSHGEAAREGGIDAGSVASAESARTPDHGGAKWAPVWEFVRMLTLSPESAGGVYIAALKKQGWSETAIVQITMIAGIYALYNRIVFGLGFDLPENVLREAGRSMARRGQGEFGA